VEHRGENPLQNVIAIIPARYASVRLPGKLLLPIDGRPLIVHTIERAKAARTISRVIVATDDERIRDVVVESGGEAVMTSPDHKSGTDRVAEVAANFPAGSIVVNVQGDEPLISPDTIDAAVNALVADHSAQIATTSEPIDRLSELLNGNIVKVVTGDAGYAIHFSRSPMPFPRDASLRYNGDPGRALVEEPELMSLFRKHTGLYAYRREYLLRMTGLPQTRLEKIEMLEQLRALEDGAKIRVVDSVGLSIGVDTEEDYERACRIVESKRVVIRKATLADVADVARVHVESWQQSFEDIAPEAYLNGMSVERRKEVFGQRLAEPSYRLLVAEIPNRGVVGFIDFGKPDFENYGYDARIYSFYVLRDYQHLGIGRQLFEAGFTSMKEDGFASACLDTLEMSPYRRFYEKYGGEVVAHDSHKLGDEEFATAIYGWRSLER
jgi:3-deoxy-manno-octulosonate cytidylyltransferase (CMP-KDO synthetase)